MVTFAKMRATVLTILASALQASIRQREVAETAALVKVKGDK